jgi:YebC/PmpR family DNA-binding regulatory protein
MSGHSKWHHIKRQKNANDAKKSKIFSKISRLVSVAARDGGGDPESNPSLRLAVQKARDARMPNENIERAIKKGTGELEGENYQEAIYEGFGPEGGAILISCLTDNNNRTVSEIRNLLGRFGGSLGAKGSTSYIFDNADHQPSYILEIDSEAKASKVGELLELLDDHDDVQEVYHNYNIQDEESDEEQS